MEANLIKNNPKTIFAWCVYDWANSVHALVIVSAIFPVYYGGITKSDGSEMVDFLGWQIKNSVLFSYAISVAFLLIALLNPILTAVADYSGKKKAFMQFFVYLGSLSTALLFFFTDATITQSVILFSISLVGFSGSIVFYNAYLPEIATEDQYDRISGRGFAFGYVGSVLLMVLCLGLILPHKFLGISEELAVRIGFLMTGIWWMGFAQYTFWHLPKVQTKPKNKNWLLNSLKELQKVWKEIGTQNSLKKYLFAFFFFNMGVQTVMYIAAIFGEIELKIPGNLLLMTVLLIQILAVFGANFCVYLSARLGNTKALRWIVGLWIGICISAIFINQTGFYILAAVIGFVMGGIQSLARATFAKLMPENTPNRASYFGVYDMADKFSIVLGTFSYGFIEQISGSVRNSVAVLAIYFLIGLLILFLIPSKVFLK